MERREAHPNRLRILTECGARFSEKRARLAALHTRTSLRSPGAYLCGVLLPAPGRAFFRVF